MADRQLRWTRIVRILLLVIILYAVPEALQAESWGIILQNDVVAGTDRHYSNSIGFDWSADKLADLSGENFQKWYSEAMVNLVEVFPFLNLQGQRITAGIRISHDIVTPEDTSKKELIRDDMPYAGYLSSTFSLFEWHGNVIEHYRWSMGLVGPNARGEQVQNRFHVLINNDEAKGWDNQLDNQFTVGIGYTRGYCSWKGTTHKNGMQASWLNTISIDLGNFYTGGTFGSAFQFGSNFPEDTFILTNISFGNTRTQLRSNSTPAKWGWSITTGAYISALGYIYYLDDSANHDLKRDILVGHGFVGLNLCYNHFQISFTIQSSRLTINETKQTDSWGTFTLSWI